MSTGPDTHEPGPDTDPDQGRSVSPQAPSVTAGRRGRLRRVPAVVWALVGLQFLLGLLCTVLYPPFTGYDESWHADMVWSYYHFNGVDGPGERLRDRGVERAVEMVPVPNPVPKLPYAQTPLPGRDQRQSFDALEDGHPLDYAQPNQMTQHPPLYYATEAALLRAVPGSASLHYDQQVWLMRLFTLLMMLPLPLLCWATARRLTGDGTIAVLAAAIPVTLPGLARLAGSVNNDNLLIVLTAALTYLLVRVVTGDRTVRTGVWVGIVTGLALLTKGFALAFPVVIVVAYVIAWLQARAVIFRPLLAAGVVTAVVGGWWWVRNLVEFGAVQPSGLGPVWDKIIVGPARPGGQVGDFVAGFFRRLGNRLWSGIGLPDDPQLPHVLTYGWLVLLGLALLGALAFGLHRQRWSRATAVLLTLPALGALTIVFIGALHSYQYNQRYGGIQGRYVYTGIAGLAVLAAWGWSRLTGPAARWLTPVVVTAGLATQLAAWYVLLDAWWAPRTGVPVLRRLWQGLDGVDRWAPWPAGVTAAVIVLTAATALLALALAVRYVLTTRSDEPRAPAPAAADPVPVS